MAPRPTRPSGKKLNAQWMVSRLALAKAAFGDARPDRIAHRGRHQFAHVDAKDRDFLDQPRHDPLQDDRGHQEYRLEPGGELMVNPHNMILLFVISAHESTPHP